MSTSAKNKKYLPVSSKIIAGILGISAFLTFFITLTQVLLDYRADLSELDRQLDQIKRSYVNSLAESVWSLNVAQIKANLDGIRDFRDVALVEVFELGERTYYNGEVPDGRVMVKEIDIVYSAQDVEEKIGTLKVTASLNRVEEKLTYKVFFIMAAQAVKTFVTSFLILLLINFVITRHLQKIKVFLEEYTPEKPGKLLTLDRNRHMRNRYEDDIDYLALSINKMVSDLNSLYKDLEYKVKERTIQLEIRTREIQSMLENMKQGVFTFDETNCIALEYSHYLEVIFEQTELAGKNAIDLIFNHASISGDEFSKVKSALCSIFGENELAFAANNHVFPRELPINVGDKEKIIEINWEFIGSSSGIVERMMVIIRDVTELRKLQLEADKHRKELSIIDQIVKAGFVSIKRFMEASVQQVDHIGLMLSAQNASKHDKMDALLRDLHSIKGNARTLGLTYIVNCVHEIETSYVELRKLGSFEFDMGRTLQDLELIRASLAEYQNTIDNKLSIQVSNHEEAGFLAQFDDEFLSSQADHGQGWQSSIAKLIERRIGMKYAPLSAILKDILESLPAMARQLDKDPPAVHIQDQGLLFNREHTSLFMGIFSHLFANAVDHGLGSAQSRAEMDKPRRGSIWLTVRSISDHVELEFYDDGPGLNLKDLREKSVKLGRQGIDEENLGELIFRSGVSTSREVTTISGRGIGLDAVRAYLQTIDGRITIEYTHPANSGGYRPFKFLLVMPASILFVPSHTKLAA